MDNKMRCHPSIIIEKAGGFFIAWILIFLGQIDEIIAFFTTESFHTEDLSFIFLILGLMIILPLAIGGYQFIVWRSTWIYMDQSTFIIERNTLNRRKQTYGITHISNINIEQNLFELLIHTCHVKLDMENAADAGSTDISIVLSLKKAHELKTLLLTVQNGGVPLDTTSFQETGSHASFSDILTHCVCSLSTAFWVILLGFAVFLGFMLWDGISPAELVTEDAGDDPILGILAIAIFLISYGYQIVKRLLTFYHFSVSRNGSNISIRYGFFRKQDYTIPVNHIHALRIIQAPIARLFHFYEAQIVCVGIGDEEEELTQLTLCCKKETFCRKMAELLPEFPSKTLDNVNRPPRHTGKLYVLSFFLGTVIACSILFLVMYCSDSLNAQEDFVFLLCMELLMILCFLLYYLFKYRCLGLYLGDSIALFCGGTFKKTVTLVPYQKIQYLDFKQNPLSGRLHLFKGDAFILASILNRIIELPYMEEKDKMMLAEKMISG